MAMSAIYLMSSLMWRGSLGAFDASILCHSPGQAHQSTVCSTSHDQKIVVLDFSQDLDGAPLFI
jgi:hypothetical protein